MKASKYYGPEPIKLDTFNTIEAINAGDETDDWLDCEITVYRGKLRYRGEEQDGICVRVPPLQEGETAPLKEKPTTRKSNGDVDDDIPF